MKAITDYTQEEYEKMQQKLRALNEAIKGSKHDELFSYTKRRGYAKYDFWGTYTDKLVEALGGRHPTAEEIIMLIDGGFSHFGAACMLNPRQKAFSGHVYID